VIEERGGWLTNGHGQRGQLAEEWWLDGHSAGDPTKLRRIHSCLAWYRCRLNSSADAERWPHLLHLKGLSMEW
jgi:hypothetical protein